MHPAKLACLLIFLMSNPGDVPAQSTSYAFIQQYHAAFERALTQHQSSLLAAYHAPDMRLMPPFQKTIKGAENVMAYYHALSNRFSLSKTTFNSHKVFALDTLLVELGTFEHTIKPKAGGAQFAITGNYLHLWDIRDRGKPMLINDVWNVASTPFNREQLRFRELPTVDVALAPHLPVNDDASFELAALNRMMEATIAQHDAAAWSLFYADDASLLASDGKYYGGKNAIQQYLIDHCADMPVFEKLDIRNDQITDVGGGFVIEYASHIAVWRYDEHSGIGLGKDFRIWQRQRNGRLKMLVHIGAYD